jgi:predicted AAA+ superfamily ATPase
LGEIGLGQTKDFFHSLFVLSGSANLALLKNVSESLAGRAVYVPLMPFNRRETEGHTSNEPRLFAMFESGEVARQRREGLGIDDEMVLDGGFPEVALGKVRDRRLWFRGYESTYVERDLRDLTQVADLVTFRTLMRMAALRTGGLLNVSEIAREAKMPVSTATRYLGALEVSYLIERVPPFLNSKASRLIKMPKVYVADSGLAANLCGIDDISLSAGERMRGALYETYFHRNLRAMTAAHRPDIEIGYWNVQGRHEVDFVLSTPRRALAIEVKSGPRVAPEDAQGLKALMNSSTVVKLGLVAYLGKETTKLADSIWAIPMGSLLA